MDAGIEREPERWWRRTVLSVAAILGVAAGLFGSVFGPYYIGAVGVVLAVVGLLGARRRWARLVLVVGLAIVAGACAYVLIGILTPDGPGSGSGSGTAG